MRASGAGWVQGAVALETVGVVVLEIGRIERGIRRHKSGRESLDGILEKLGLPLSVAERFFADWHGVME